MRNNLPSNTNVSENHVPLQLDVYNYGAIPGSKNNFYSLLNVILKRKWYVLIFFFSVVTLTALYVFLATPIYRASTILQITQDNPTSMIGERDPMGALFAGETQSRFYETQFLLLNNKTLAYRIIDALNLCEGKYFEKLKESYPEKSFEDLKGLYAITLVDNIDIKPLKRSFLVEISYKDEDKFLSQEVVNIISKEYMKFAMETRRQSYAMIRDWLDNELKTLAGRVEDSERKLYEYGQKKDILSMEDKNQTTLKKYVEISYLLTRAQSERMGKEAQYKQIKEKRAESPLIANNPLIMRLREEAISQEARVSSLNKIYDNNYPQLQVEQGKLKELNSRVTSEINRQRASIEADYQASLKTENLLQDALEAQKGKVNLLQENLVRAHILKRDMQANEQIYQGLLSRMKEASVASTMIASNVAVITAAELPLKPYSPRKKLSLLIASIVGLAGGIGLAFFIERMDSSIKTSTEVETLCRLPVLGIIPLYDPKGTNQKVGMICQDQPKSMITEAFRQIRTSLMLSSAGGPPATFVVTSPNPNEGKSTTAVNMAVALAMHGSKVVLIDADLRRPSVHKILQMESQPGLSGFLSKNASLSAILHPTIVSNLSFIPSGVVPPNPTELLASNRMGELINELLKDFQHVIFDTPPIIEFADARVLSSVTEGVLLVLRQHSTTREAGLLAAQLLSQVNVKILGAVLNMSTTNRLGYGYYGYYNYNYYNRKYLPYYDKDPDQEV
jgi:capsular exopolysaccharide synthesis family protein